MVTALVTGATGFVGSHVARALADAGHRVRALHRAASKLDALNGIPYESYIGDILDSDALCAACAGCDWVFHVAAVADYWRADHNRMMEANVEGTRRVLAAARAMGVRRVVFTSSAAAVGGYGIGRLADERDPFDLPPDLFPYGYSKWLAEGVARAAAAAGQDVVIVNPVVVLGPGDLNVISGAFVLKIHRYRWLFPVTSGGVAVTDVRDVARWHVAAAARGVSGERYLLGTANLFYPAWYALIADAIGVARPGIPVPAWLLPPLAGLIDTLKARGIQLPIDGDQARLGAKMLYYDFNKAWTTLGAPQIDMRQSARDTFAWYAAHGYVKGAE
ncbi:MAG: NAD-dependent epimerase/dehydratase family protein [Chloroflexota bacterium]|nr:NAD-dependent epimerase/dehydratase family protein [Chloroflexota bacterium]